jgi:hypothetical protein
MGFIDQVYPNRTLTPASPLLAKTDLPVEPGQPATRVNWLFSGVLLGAGGWLLVLGVIFLVIGNWIVAAGLLGGLGLCLLAMWRAGRRLRRAS